MPLYPPVPSSSALIANLSRQVRQVQAQLASRTLAGNQPGTYAANSISNGTMEGGAGIDGWVTSVYEGGPGQLAIDTATPIAGTTSLQVIEQTGGASFVAWCPSGSTTAPTVGTDVFPTVPGDQWLVSATFRADSDPLGNTGVYAVFGTNPADCYTRDFANQNYVAGAQTALPVSTVQTLSGLATCPDNRLFVTLAVAADDLGGLDTGWTWDVDTLGLQKKL